MPAQAGLAIRPAIGLPAIDEPWLNLQLVCGKPLYPQPIEEPRCIRRNKRRLVGPIIKIVITEESDVRNKDAGIHVQSVIHIKVISTPGLRDIAISIGEV